MPRDGSGIYHRPVGTDAVTDTTIESAKYNVNVADVETDLNTPRPLVAGGTGATSADGVLDNISAEKFKQVVTNWDAMVWRAGSFYAATTATGTAPVSGHAFAGICYYANATDLVLEATDLTDAADTTDATDPSTINQYIRVMTASVWGPWRRSGGGAATSTGDYLFDSTITFPPAAGQIRFNNATQNSTTELFISHTTAGGADNTGLITASVKSGYTLYIQDKDEPTKYKTFVTTANPVLSGGDFRVTVTYLGGGIDIVSAQRVVLSVTTGSAVCYDIAQSLTANQRAQARANIDVLKKNYIINGAMMISQENGTTAGTVATYFGADQFAIDFVNAGTQTIQQVVSATTGGSTNRLRVTATVADASVAAGDYSLIYHNIEGYRVADLMIGTASAKTVTLQFGVKAPAGTYCVSFHNGVNNRIYVAEYVIAAGEANTDVVKSVVVALDQTGTWAKDNTKGLQIAWALMAGTTFQTAAGSWAAGSFHGSSNQFNFMGTGGNVFELFDVSLTEGSVAPPFMVPDYVSELALCKRYWQRTRLYTFAYSVAGTTNVATWMQHSVEMRTQPGSSSIVFSNFSNCTAATSTVNPSGHSLICNVTATGPYLIDVTYGENARL